MELEWRWNRWIKWILFLTFLGSVGGCSVFMNGIGTVTPFGDVKELVGSTVRLLCILDKDHPDVSPGDSENLIWKKSGVDVSPQYTRVTGNFTNELFIPNANASDTGVYFCLLKRRDTSKLVCTNNVMVGTAPQNITDFSCISPNWQYLTCQFSMTSNAIQPTYHLSYIRVKSRLGNTTCNLTLDKRRKMVYCNITSLHTPPYSQTETWFKFTLNANNTFGFRSWNFNIKNFEIVRPDPPSDVKLRSSSPRSLNITWSPHELLKLFPPGLLYRIYYKSQWDRDDDWKVIYSEENYTLVGLIPFTNYTIKIQAKSKVATEDKYWGDNTTSVFQTSPDVPEEPPRLPWSSFREISYLNNRTVILYWQMIPNYERNGLKFRYNVVTSTDDGMLIHPQNVTDNFAIFNNLQLERNYVFNLSSVNEIGKSKNDSTLTVYKKSMIPSRPESFTTIFFGNGVYELSWKPNKNSKANKFSKRDVSSHTSFTLFWCNNIKPHPFTCLGNLSWIHVNEDVRAYNVTVRDETVNYHFAIAANDGLVSSGMVWATCIVPYNGTLNKMKTPDVIPMDSSSLKVTWALDCSERIGIVSGFKVYYCPIVINATKASCAGEQASLFQKGSHAKETIISGLSPYSLYKVTVAAITRAGEGEQSDVTIGRTRASPPSLASLHLDVNNITNTSVTVTWQTPVHANGVIESYKLIYGREKIDIVNTTTQSKMTYTIRNMTSYTNYTIELKACNSAGCSNDFRPIVVETEIGVPGIMSRPQVTPRNISSVMVSFEDPVYPNGPIDFYNLMITMTNGDHNETFWKKNLSSPELDVPIKCDDKDFVDAVYTFAVEAINIVNGHYLQGPLSDSATYTCLGAIGGLDYGMVGGIVAATIGVSALVLIIGYLYCRCRRQVNEMKNIKIYLPRGLETDNFKSPSSDFCAPYPNKTSSWIGPGSQPDYVNSRQRNTSGETRLSVTSMDELLQGHGTGRLNQIADTNSGLSSVSSAQTTRSNLSSDSASSDLDNLPPTTPDAVFADPLPNLHKLQLPSATLDILPEASPPANYSQLARNFGSDGYLPTTTPIAMQSNNGSEDDGYVLPSNSGSYSQLGIAGGNYMNVPTVNLVNEDETTNEVTPAYSQVGMVPATSQPLQLSNGYVVPKSIENLENGNLKRNDEEKDKAGSASNSKMAEEDNSLPIQYSRLSFHDPKAGNGYVTLPEVCPPPSTSTTPAPSSKMVDDNEPVPSTSRGHYVAFELVGENDSGVNQNQPSDDVMKASLTSDEGMKSSMTSSDDVMKSSLTSDGYDSPGPYSRVVSMNFDENAEKDS